MIFLSFLLGCSHSIKSTYIANHDVWYFVPQNDTIFFDFGTEKFQVDTIDFYEGIVFYHKAQSDSSYFRMNSFSGWARYECCSNDSIYNITSTVDRNNIVDNRGKVSTNENLYWRSLRCEDFDVVYNYCPLDKLKQYDKVLDSVYEQYIRHSSSTTDE